MVIAKLHFIKPLALYETEKPYFLKLPGKEGLLNSVSTNLEYSQYDDIHISDIRLHDRAAFSTERSGFEVLENNFVFGRQITTTAVEAYCHIIVDMMSRRHNAVHTLCYDYRIRENDRKVVDYESFEADRTKSAPPVLPVHIDHTDEGGWQRARRHLTEEEARIYLTGQHRVRIINVWRPLWDTVEDMPLAICDPQTIDPDDLLAADRVSSDFALEIYYLKFNSNQKWYWLSRQTTSELFMFLNYDSECKLGSPGWKSCPHAAFRNPEAASDAPSRASIELRLIVLTPTTAEE